MQAAQTSFMPASFCSVINIRTGVQCSLASHALLLADVASYHVAVLLACCHMVQPVAVSSTTIYAMVWSRAAAAYGGNASTVT